jgi:hypothetical protein
MSIEKNSLIEYLRALNALQILIKKIIEKNIHRFDITKPSNTHSLHQGRRKMLYFHQYDTVIHTAYFCLER